MIKLLWLVFVTLLILNHQLSALPAYAQTSPGEITSVYEIADTEANDGDIIESSTEGMFRAKTSYSNRIFGVLQLNPTLVYRSFDDSLKPITRLGQASINVTTLNGEIVPGDYITSSQIAGKGQKATQSGYVVGIALTGLKAGEGSALSYQASSSSQSQQLTSGKITVAVKIDYAEIATPRFLSRIDNLLSFLFSNVDDPSRFIMMIRYIGASLIILLSFGLGFLTFSRSLPKAVEAIGRNPLATRSIHISMAISIGLTISSIIAGLVAAMIILRL